MQFSQTNESPSTQNLSNFLEEIKHALQNELQQALRAELPTALEKELPRALRGGRSNVRIREPQSEGSTSDVTKFAGLPDALPPAPPHKPMTAMTHTRSLHGEEKRLHAERLHAGHERLHGEDEDDIVIGHGGIANKYTAKKFFQETAIGEKSKHIPEALLHHKDHHKDHHKTTHVQADKVAVVRHSTESAEKDAAPVGSNRHKPRKTMVGKAIAVGSSIAHRRSTAAPYESESSPTVSTDVTGRDKDDAPLVDFDLRTVKNLGVRKGEGAKPSNRLSADRSWKLMSTLGDSDEWEDLGGFWKCWYSLNAKALDIVFDFRFEQVTTCIIAANAISIGVQTDYIARASPKTVPVPFKVIEVLFCLAFTVELFFRMVAFQWNFFIIDWKWNLFDALLVFLQIFDISLEAALGDTEDVGPNVSFIRILRILRLVRIIRLVRVIRYISELRTIIASVANSLKCLGFTILIIAFLIYIQAVFLTQLVSDKLKTANAQESVALKEHWDSVLRSCLTLFQSVTNGLDWSSAAGPLMDHISPVMAVFYCFYIAFTMFAMLNVITGVFVESALASDAEEKEIHMVSRLLDFLAKSEHGSGELTWDEFESRLNDPLIQLYFKSVDLDVAEARGLFRLLDTDDSGTVEAEEFVMGCLRLRGNAKAIDLATLMYENRRFHRKFMDRLIKIEGTFEFRALGSTLSASASMAPYNPALEPHEDPTASRTTKNSIGGDGSLPLEDIQSRPLVRPRGTTTHPDLPGALPPEMIEEIK